MFSFTHHSINKMLNPRKCTHHGINRMLNPRKNNVDIHCRQLSGKRALDGSLQLDGRLLVRWAFLHLQLSLGWLVAAW